MLFSIPQYSRTNSAAKRKVQIIKNFLRKSYERPCLALLSCGHSPVAESLPPTELLMGRRLETTVMCHSKNLYPKSVSNGQFILSNDEYKARIKNQRESQYVKPLRLVEMAEKAWFRSSQRWVQIRNDSSLWSFEALPIRHKS